MRLKSFACSCPKSIITHCRKLIEENITKTNVAMTLLKFNEAHGIQYLDLDPVTNIALALSTGAYGLGTTS